MKKVVLGAMMFLAGLVSTALLLAGAISLEWTVNGNFSAFWNLSLYGLMPVFYTFVGIATLGLGFQELSKPTYLEKGSHM